MWAQSAIRNTCSACFATRHYESFTIDSSTLPTRPTSTKSSPKWLTNTLARSVRLISATVCLIFIFIAQYKHFQAICGFGLFATFTLSDTKARAKRKIYAAYKISHWNTSAKWKPDEVGRISLYFPDRLLLKLPGFSWRHINLAIVVKNTDRCEQSEKNTSPILFHIAEIDLNGVVTTWKTCHYIKV